MSTNFGKTIRHHWLLEDCYFLNNGSFGATPRSVLEVQRQWQERLERQPVRFVMSELPTLLRQTATTMAQFMGAEGEDLVFVDNASTAVNTVLRGLVGQLQPGDELLTTSHVYNAVRQTFKYICSITGARYVEVPVPFPIASPQEVVQRVEAALTERTRFALFDHVTSATGILYPVEDLVRLCKSRGIKVMIDGAHTPGMLDPHLNRLGADWYTGNFHKWLFAPKGSAFLWTAKEHQATTHSVIISHGYTMGYHAEFDFNGTKDWSPFLSAPEGLAFLQSLGVEEVRGYNHQLALKAREHLLNALPQAEPAPTSMLTSMVSIVLPIALEEDPMAQCRRIHDSLWQEHAIETPVFPLDDNILLRIAAQVYNEESEYAYLADVLKKMFAS